MSSSPLSSSLFHPLSTLSTHCHGRRQNLCFNRKQQPFVVRAAKLPEGVTFGTFFQIFKCLSSMVVKSCFSQVIVPKAQPKSQPAFLGFTQTAEIWNSRACMIGLIGTFIVELVRVTRWFLFARIDLI